jgi:hypothetical protein
MPLSGRQLEAARLQFSKDIPVLIEALARNNTAMDAANALAQIGSPAVTLSPLPGRAYAGGQ